MPTNNETTVLINNTDIKIHKFKIIYIRPTLYIRNKLIKFKLKNIAYISYFYLNIISAGRAKKDNIYLNLYKNIFKIYKNY